MRILNGRKGKADALLSLVLLAWLAGCATPPHRARQYSEAYQALPQETQQRSLHGYIREGDSPQAVYIAMGPPQSRESKTAKAGLEEVHWLYLGRHASGQTVLDQGNYRFVTQNDSAWQNPFDTARTRRIRLVFFDDHLRRVELEDNDGQVPLQAFPEIIMPQ